MPARRQILLLCVALLPPAVRAQDPLLPETPPAQAPPTDAPPAIPPEAWEGVEKVPLRLRHRFEPGVRARYELRQRVEVDSGGVAPGHAIDQTFLVEHEVVERLEGGGARMRETYQAVVYTLEAAGQKMTVDTRDGTTSGHPVVDAMGAMVGAVMESRLAADGKVEGVAGGDALLERLLAAMPDQVREPMRVQLGQLLSDETLGKQTQESYVVFPERELAPGDSWRRENTTPVPNVGELTYRFDYVYLGAIERPCGRCAKLLVRVRTAGCEPRETVINGAPGTVSVEPFESTSLLVVRADDGSMVEAGPQVLELTVRVEVQGLKIAVNNKTTTRAELLPMPSEEPTRPR